MNNNCLFVFITIFSHLSVFAEQNIASFGHGDIRNDPKIDEKLTKNIELGDRVETTPKDPDWRADNYQYYGSDDYISDYDELDDSQESKEGINRDGNTENKTLLRDILLASMSNTADEELLSKSKDDSDYLDYSRDITISGRRNMDSNVVTAKADSGTDSNVPTLLPNTYPLHRRYFAPFPNPWRMPITITYPTARFSSVLKNPYSLGATTTGPISSQDYSNNKYPFMGNKEFVFHPLKTIRTLF
nr:uncharacterized protein LOC128681250 [Plodia interpunctella]